jgi:hypothetical protein
MIHAISSGASRTFTIALTVPARPQASEVSRHAGLFLSRKATRSPGSRPKLVCAPAARRMRSAHSLHVQDRSPSPMATRSGVVVSQWRT